MADRLRAILDDLGRDLAALRLFRGATGALAGEAGRS